MSAGSLLTHHQIEAFVICLAASIVWAPIIFIVAHALDRKAVHKLSDSISRKAREAIWLGALALAAAPSLMAPGLAAFGLSLRPAEQTATAQIEPSSVAASNAIITDVSATENATEPPAGAASGEAFAGVPDSASYTDGSEGADIATEIGTSGFAAASAGDLPAFAVQDFSRLEALKSTGLETLSWSQVVRTGAIIYGYGAFLAFVLWGARTGALWLAGATAQAETNPAVLAGLDKWRRQFGLKARPAVRRSPHVSSVCVFGLFRPVILVPRDLETTVKADDVVMMCAHELAHIRRGDTLLFFATAMARAIFWFNPFIKLIATRTEFAAEESADAEVLARGADRRAYAACFVRGLRYAAARTARLNSMTPAFTAVARHGRRRRLSAILAGGDKADAAKGARTLAASISLMGAAGTAGLAAAAQAAVAVNPASVENRPAFLAAALAPKPPAPPIGEPAAKPIIEPAAVQEPTEAEAVASTPEKPKAAAAAPPASLEVPPKAPTAPTLESSLNGWPEPSPHATWRATTPRVGTPSLKPVRASVREARQTGQTRLRLAMSPDGVRVDIAADGVAQTLLRSFGAPNAWPASKRREPDALIGDKLKKSDSRKLLASARDAAIIGYKLQPRGESATVGYLNQPENIAAPSMDEAFSKMEQELEDAQCKREARMSAFDDARRNAARTEYDWEDRDEALEITAFAKSTYSDAAALARELTGEFRDEFEKGVASAEREMERARREIDRAQEKARREVAKAMKEHRQELREAEREAEEEAREAAAEAEERAYERSLDKAMARIEQQQDEIERLREELARVRDDAR